MNKLGLVVVLISFPVLLAAQGDIGARPLGMGRAFVAIVDDGNAPAWNPAGMSLYNERILSGMFSRLYMGIHGDALGEAYINYIHHFKMGSVGISFNQFFSNLWRETRLSLSYSRLLPQTLFRNKFGLGVTVHFLRNEVVRGNITYSPQIGDAENGIADPLNDPYFAKHGWDKIGFTGDVGMFYQATPELTFGAQVANLNQPNMTLGNIGGEVLPLTARIGAAYRFREFLIPTLEFVYENRDINGKKRFEPHIGVEWWFMNNLWALRTGFNPEEYAFGFTYRTKKALDLQIDYAFVYPLSTLRETGATTHKFSASLRFLPPPPPLIDLSLRSQDLSVYPKNAILNEPVTITAFVENLGERSVKDVKVSLSYEDPQTGWTQAIPVTVVDEIGAGEKKELTFKWTPPGKGHYQVFAAVDDDGTMLPNLHGEIPELDEENNRGAVEFDVFPLPKGEVKPQQQVLEISRVTLIREEEPIVPIVFFDPMDTRVDDRFLGMLETISRRLEENPDLQVVLYGYYNPASEAVGSEAYGEKLATERAKSVRSIMTRFSPGVRDRIVIAPIESYDPSRWRVGHPEEILPEDVDRVNAENRRVEIKASLKGFEDWKYVINFDRNSKTFNPQTLEEIKPEATKLKTLLERNRELILLFEGFNSKDEGPNEELAFARAFNVKKAFEDAFGADFVRMYGDRLFVRGNTARLVDRGKVELGLSGESMIYRPREGSMAASGYELDENQTNFLRITSEVEAGVDSFRVSIVDSKGNTFRVLAEGVGEIPTGIPWDWKDAEGNLINPNEVYFCKLEIKDRLGQRAVAYSDTIKVEVTKRQQQVETLIIVQFTFDEEISESKFLESRIEYIARKFIEKAMEPKKSLTAVVSGHTDVIGFDYRNRELSIERAKKEEGNLRRYLIYLLGLKDNAELNLWLKRHNTTLTYKGYADTKPYVITKWQNNQMEEVQIGNDELPEGRTINRRVVIEFYMEKEGPEKAQPQPTP